MILIQSCGLGPRNLDGFENYSKPISFIESNYSSLDGIYISINSVHENADVRDALSFIDKGNCFIYSVDKNYWSGKEMKLVHYYNNKSLKDNYDFFAYYSITNDTLNIQHFVKHNDRFYSQFVIERKYKIINDSALSYFEWSSYRGDLLGDKKKETYTVNDTFIKANSESVKFSKPSLWYQKKNWFNEKLHESRKD